MEYSYRDFENENQMSFCENIANNHILKDFMEFYKNVIMTTSSTMLRLNNYFHFFFDRILYH